MTARGVGMRFLALSVVAILSSSACAAEPREIPLKDIWAYRMPGTRDIGKLEKDRPPRQEHGRLVGNIRRALGTTLEKGKVAGSAFLVPGTGIDALREAHAVLVEKRKPRVKFAQDGDVSIVFFSRSFGAYVELDNVRRQGNVVDIRYRFRNHSSADMTEHIAIIPLTSLTAGKYRINVIQLPVDKDSPKYEFAFFEPEIADKVVSSSFSFSVE